MNQINGRAWVEALRSGKYTQGIRTLRRVDRETGECTHCCLGVVTELAVAAGVLPPGVLKYDAVYYSTMGTYEESGALPSSVREWLEVDTAIPTFNTKEGRHFATTLNDKLNYSFAQIADLIEAEYLQPTNSDESN